MKLELLVSTMNQEDLKIAEDMGIKTDAVIINQCGKQNYNEILMRNNILLKVFSFNERGIGRSRNKAIQRTEADICVLADDDMVYVSNYEEIIKNEFLKKPEADVIIFSVTIIDQKGEVTKKLKDNKKIRFFNYMKFGASRIAFRKNSIKDNNLSFSNQFGGGAKYGSGEDSLFLKKCLNSGLNIYTSSKKIADVYNFNSSWFEGYNERYFRDKGALFKALYPSISLIIAVQFVIRKRSLFNKNISLFKAFKYTIKGIKEYEEEYN